MAIFDQAHGKEAQNRARQNYLQQIEKMVAPSATAGSGNAVKQPAMRLPSADKPMAPTKVFGRRG